MSKSTSPSIQQNLNKLDELVKYFEQNENFDLDQALANYEEAMKLVSEVSKTLKGFELKVKEIREKYEAEEVEE